MKDSVAIVTGASQGIGRSTAIRLARDFSAVVLAARNAKALEEVATAVQTAGAEPLPLAADLSQVEAPKIVVDTTLERFGRIDALLNIAGAVPQIDLFEMTDEQWKAGMEVEIAWCPSFGDSCVGRSEACQRLRGFYVRQRRA